jgi:hypothetical protein
MHPPLRLRLQNPLMPFYLPNSDVPMVLPEPGYLLERLPVRSMHEVQSALRVSLGVLAVLVFGFEALARLYESKHGSMPAS